MGQQDKVCPTGQAIGNEEDYAELCSDIMLGIVEGMTADQLAEYFATLTPGEKRALAEHNEQADKLLQAEIIAQEEAEYAADDWDWFEHITAADRAYLTARHHKPDPCVWCGGRHKHNPTCLALTEGFVVRMPWGKHKGAVVSDVPKDYLRWLLRKGVDLEADLKREVCRVLNVPLFEESDQ